MGDKLRTLSPVVNRARWYSRLVTAQDLTTHADPVAAAMRRRILVGAADALRQLPLSKVTMEDIARAAGVARQTIYKHFANRDEIVVALFVAEIEQTHHPRLAAMHAEERSPDRLTDMFIEQISMASQWVLLDRTFDPKLAPRVAELVLSSEALAACNAALWGPMLADYRDEGVVRADLDIDRAVRWMTYQAVWFLSHPGALTSDPAEQRAYVRAFLVDALVDAAHR